MWTVSVHGVRGVGVRGGGVWTGSVHAGRGVDGVRPRGRGVWAGSVHGRGVDGVVWTECGGWTVSVHGGRGVEGVGPRGWGCGGCGRCPSKGGRGRSTGVGCETVSDPRRSTATSTSPSTGGRGGVWTVSVHTGGGGCGHSVGGVDGIRTPVHLIRTASGLLGQCVGSYSTATLAAVAVMPYFFHVRKSTAQWHMTCSVEMLHVSDAAEFERID